MVLGSRHYYKRSVKNVFQIDVRVMIEPYNGAPVCFGYDSVFQEENAEIYNELKMIKGGNHMNTSIEKRRYYFKYRAMEDGFENRDS